MMSIQHRRCRLLLVYVLGALPLVAWGGMQALRPSVDSPLEWVPDSFPARRDYETFCRQFGTGEVLVVSWAGCTLDSPALRRLADVLRTPEYFRDADGNACIEGVVTGQELFAQLSSPPIGLSHEAALARLRGTFIGADSRTTCALVSFTAAGRADRRRVVPLVRAILDRHCGIAPADQRFAGPIVDGLSVDRASYESLDRFAFPSAALVFVLCWWCLGSLRAGLLVFALSVYCEAASLAILHYCGDRMSALLIVMPPLVQVLAVSGGVHLVNYYYAALREVPPRDAAWHALRLGWLPCTLSAATTAIGMASLMSSHLTPIRSFGAYSAAGVMLTAAALLAVIPATFALWPPRVAGQLAASGRYKLDAPASAHRGANALAGASSLDSSGQATLDGLVQRGFSWLCRMVARFHAEVAIGSLIIMSAVGWGAWRLQTSVRIETLFAPHSRILTDYAWLEQHVAPLVPIEVVVHCAADSSLSPLEQLELVGRVERGLGELCAAGENIGSKALERGAQLQGTGVPYYERTGDNASVAGGTMSAATFLPPRPNWPGLPQVAQRRILERQMAHLLPQFVTARYLHESASGRSWRISLRTSALGNADYANLLARVQNRLQSLVSNEEGQPLPGVSASATGVMPLVHSIQHALVDDLLASFLGALIVITIVMTLVQGGVLVGLVSMISNVFPILLLFGGLGWMQVPLDVGSVMTASVAMGIAVDDTLHFLTFVRQQLDAGSAIRPAVEHAYRHCGLAMAQSSVICGLGLSVFGLSDFVPTARFAWMMLALLAAALFGDLVVLPAFLLGPVGRLFARSQAPPQPYQFAHCPDFSPDPDATRQCSPVSPKPESLSHATGEQPFTAPRHRDRPGGVSGGR